LKQEINIKT